MGSNLPIRTGGSSQAVLHFVLTVVSARICLVIITMSLNIVMKAIDTTGTPDGEKLKGVI